MHAHDDPADAGGPPPLPAGVDLDAYVGERPTTRRRGRLRRRLRHLRAVREVLLRDLGGLVLEVHRSGAGVDAGRSDVLRGKLGRLEAVTAELRELEDVLGDRRGSVLREPGIGGTCPTCGELFGSEARFGWACGTPVAPGATRHLRVGADAAPPALAAAAATHGGTPEPPAAPGEGPPPGRPSRAVEAPPGADAEPHIEGSGEELHPDGRDEDAPTAVRPPRAGADPAEATGAGAARSAALANGDRPAPDEARTRELEPDTVVGPRPQDRPPELRQGDPLAERRP